MRRKSEFKFEIGTHFKDDKRDLTIVDRKRVESPYKKGTMLKYYNYKCNKCGYNDGCIVESHLNEGRGCSCCANRTVVEGINDIPTTASWMIKFFQGGYDEAKMYTKTSNQKIYPICPDCGRVRDKEISICNIYKNKSIGCSCGDGISYPNKFMFNVLEQLNIKFINEYSPEWIGKKLYDFYVPSKNIIIEMDGRLGHGKIVHNRSDKTAKETKAGDIYKDKLAKENGIIVIRINCDKSELEHIKQNILKSELIDYFDFVNIDWLKVEEFALSNRCKEACDLKRNNPDMTTVEIGKIIGSNKGIIRGYLKKGVKLGWCTYNPIEEMKRVYEKSSSKIIEICSKPLEMFKDGISLGVFDSASELSRQSEKLFGVKLNNSKISSVLRGEKTRYKGFTFILVGKSNDNHSSIVK